MATLFDQLFDAHVVRPLDDGVFLLAIDRIMLHERTGAAALNALEEARRRVRHPGHAFVVMDHIVDTAPGRGDCTPMPGGEAFIRETRAAAQRAGLHIFDVTDADQGITHVVGPELGIVLPGLTLVAPDSHTCTQGALGALACGIGTSEAEHALATGTLRVTRPRTMRVTVHGRLSPGVTAKDLALFLIARHGAGGARGHAVEFAGQAVRALPMEARLTLCNMGTEFGAFTALVAPDAVTLDYVAARRFAPRGQDMDRALAHWAGLGSHEDARFDREIVLDATEVAPMVSWGTSPAQSLPIDAAVPADAAAAGMAAEAWARAMDYMGLEPGRPLVGMPIDAAFIGSCTNSRMSDLERAAALIGGRRVAPGVRAIVVPGSSAVGRAAEQAGLARRFVEAGFEWRESGCSLCFFAGGESFGRGQRVVSSTNRNFESRQGPGTRTHIASPETVVASALAGAIADPRRA